MTNDYSPRSITTKTGMSSNAIKRLIMREQYWYWLNLVREDEEKGNITSPDYQRRVEELEMSKIVLEENGILDEE